MSKSFLADAGPEGPRVDGAKDPFRPPTRVLTSLLSAPERQLLAALCRRMPAWVTPDGLTALGAFGMTVAALGYILSNQAPEFLFLASFGIVVNWFGDSLDGSLARFRRTERARYGYFLDHSVDAFNFLVFYVGLGLSPYVAMPAALLLVCSYYLLTICVLLSAQVNRRFVLTKGWIGPTELRIIAIAFNCVVYLLGPIEIGVGDREMSLYTGLVLIEAVAFMVVFLDEVYVIARDLRGAEAPPAGRSARESEQKIFDGSEEI